MAAGDVNAQSVTLTAGGVLALVTTDAPTGSGIYTVTKDSGASAPQVITDITGGSGYALITLKAATGGDIALEHDGTTFILQEGQHWTPEGVNDRIHLRDRDGDGSVWIEEIPRGFYP